MSSDQMPAPGKTKLIKFPPSWAGKDVKCPGYARGGMLKLQFDWYIRSDLPTASSKSLDISNVNCDCRLSFFTTVWCGHPYCPPTVYFVTIRTIVQTVRTMGHFHLLYIPLPLWPTEGAIDGLGNQRGRGSLLRPFWGGNCVSTFYFLVNSEGGIVSALWASFLGDKKLTFLSLYYSESLVKLQGEVGNCERLWKVSQNCVNL